jgi:hypothetical protein
MFFMHIETAERLRPYSHSAGTSCLIPGSSREVQIFPCLIRIFDSRQSTAAHPFEISLQLKGPLDQFTVQQDLEAGKITVWGKTSLGFLRYVLTADSMGMGIRLQLKKAPDDQLLLYFEGAEVFLSVKNELFFFSSRETFQPYKAPLQERLSLGNNKAQDVDLVRRRLDLREILPAWHRLGLLCRPSLQNGFGRCAVSPSLGFGLNEGNLELLNCCQNAILRKQPEQMGRLLMNVFLASFDGIFMPRLNDCQHQGLSQNVLNRQDISPLILLSEGATLIRELLIRQDAQGIHILPFLPPELHYGRFLQVPVSGGVLSFEWTKKIIRRLIFFSQENQEVLFHFRKIDRYRLRDENEDRGQTITSGQSLFFEKNRYYFFDNFG